MRILEAAASLAECNAAETALLPPRAQDEAAAGDSFTALFAALATTVPEADADELRGDHCQTSAAAVAQTSTVVVALEDLLGRRRPRAVLALGPRSGYTAVWLAQRLRLQQGLIVAVEDDPLRAAVARAISDVVQAHAADVVVAPAHESVAAASRRLKVHAVDLFVLRGGGAFRPLEDLRKAEEAGLVGTGCLVVVLNALQPGAPRLIWHMHTSPRYALRLQRCAGTHRGGDWIAVSDVLSDRVADGQEDINDQGAPTSFPELASLAAESDACWRRAFAPPRRDEIDLAACSARRAIEAFRNVGLFRTDDEVWAGRL